MSTPRHEQPTRVLRATERQPPPPTGAPTPPAHFWRQRVPARIGRARTSTVVLAVLFLAFASLYVLVRPDIEYTTVTTTTGQTVRVPASQLSPTPEPPAPAPPTSEAPTTAPETSAPESPEEETTAPASTPPVTEDEETAEPTTTSRAPATTSRSPEAERSPGTSRRPDTGTAPEETSGPTE